MFSHESSVAILQYLGVKVAIPGIAMILIKLSTIELTFYASPKSGPETDMQSGAVEGKIRRSLRRRSGRLSMAHPLDIYIKFIFNIFIMKPKPKK